MTIDDQRGNRARSGHPHPDTENQERRDLEHSDREQNGEEGFPSGILDALESAFGWLCSRPHPVTVDGRAVPGLPAARVPLDELRGRLLDPATPAAVRDRTWAYLIRRARTDGPSWTLAAAGMARPMLTGLGAELTRRFAGDPADIHAEILTGFLTALPVVDPDRAPLVSLRWAAYRAGHAALTAALDAPRPVPPHQLGDPTGDPAGDSAGDADTDVGVGSSGHADPGDDPGNDCRDAADPTCRSGSCESSPPPSPPGHPDLVLAHAVAVGALSVTEAALIGTTRLEPVTLAQAAHALGLPLGTVASTRYRAEGRLLAHLADTTHPDTPDDAPPGRRRHPRRRRTGRRRRGGRVSARAAVRTRAAATRATRTASTTGPARATGASGNAGAVRETRTPRPRARRDRLRRDRLRGDQLRRDQASAVHTATTVPAPDPSPDPTQAATTGATTTGAATTTEVTR